MRAKFVNEAIKHLQPIPNEEILNHFKKYSIEDRFLKGIDDDIPFIIKELIDTNEIKKISQNDIKKGLVIACAQGNIEIVKMLLDNGANPEDVNLNWIDDNVYLIIREYRKKRKNKN